jgi:prolipoprotein diacylglyceryltransferase
MIGPITALIGSAAAGGVVPAPARRRSPAARLRPDRRGYTTADVRHHAARPRQGHGTLPARPAGARKVTPAVITLAFDPLLRLGPLTVRWQTVGIAGAILAGLLVAARFARGSGIRTGLERLRLDDLLYVAVAAVPGAIAGGRAVHVLVFLSYYQANPGRMVDASQGSLSLLGAVIGGACTAAYMASLLEVPVRRWADVASTPLLVAIGLGKLAMLLGGEGQGHPVTVGWAVAFAGPGPWMDPTPAIASYPSQAVEGAWALAGVIVLFILHAGPVLRRLPGGLRQVGGWAVVAEARGEQVAHGRLRFGYLFLAAIAWWLAGRVAIASTWRDEPVLGSLNAEQALASCVLALIVLGVLWGAVRPRHAGQTTREDLAAQPPP